MSVIIRGMKYPESCAECALWMYDDQGAMCPFKEHKYISDGGLQPPSDTEKGEWCPLVELPVKHGRLIDANKLRSEFPYPKDWKDTMEAYVHKTGIWAKIDCAETVVEREGG